MLWAFSTSLILSRTVWSAKFPSIPVNFLWHSSTWSWYHQLFLPQDDQLLCLPVAPWFVYFSFQDLHWENPPAMSVSWADWERVAFVFPAPWLAAAVLSAQQNSQPPWVYSEKIKKVLSLSTVLSQYLVLINSSSNFAALLVLFSNSDPKNYKKLFCRHDPVKRMSTQPFSECSASPLGCRS